MEIIIEEPTQEPMQYREEASIRARIKEVDHQINAECEQISRANALRLRYGT